MQYNLMLLVKTPEQKKHDNLSLFAQGLVIYKQLKGGGLMSSDKGFVSKDLFLVWRTEKQPSEYA